MSGAGWPFPPVRVPAALPDLGDINAALAAHTARTSALAASVAVVDAALSEQQARAERHDAIDAEAALIRAAIRRECEVLRRSVAQRIRWAAANARAGAIHGAGGGGGVHR